VLRDHFIVFDEIMVPGVVYKSSDRHHRRLAAYDLLAIYVEPYQGEVAAGSDAWVVQVAFETSGDGENWLSSSTMSATNAGPPFVGAWLGLDCGLNPLMQLVRVSVTSTGGSGGARVHATLRDQGGGKPIGAPQGGQRAP
jgi:hypothetical protein